MIQYLEPLCLSVHVNGMLPFSADQFEIKKDSGIVGTQEFICSMLNERDYQVTVGNLGNIIGRNKNAGNGEKETIIVEAHYDEVGFIVTGIDEKGFVKVDACGGADPRVLAAAEVVVWGKNLRPGVFCSTPPHLQKEEGKIPELIDCAIDIGMESKEAREAIPVGTRVSYKPHFHKLLGSRISAKSLDNRAGVAAVLRCIDLLKKNELDVTVIFSAQEELGCRGSSVAVFGKKAKAVMVVDVSFAATPDSDKRICGVIRKGPMIGISAVLDPTLSEFLIQIANKQKIPIQYEVMGNETGTDADNISKTGYGLKAALVSIPIKYMHTPNEVADLNDIESTAKLMAAFINEYE